MYFLPENPECAACCETSDAFCNGVADAAGYAYTGINPGDGNTFCAIACETHRRPTPAEKRRRQQFADMLRTCDQLGLYNFPEPACASSRS